jgi:hypothetical protein
MSGVRVSHRPPFFPFEIDPQSPANAGGSVVFILIPHVPLAAGIDFMLRADTDRRAEAVIAALPDHLKHT